MQANQRTDAKHVNKKRASKFLIFTNNQTEMKIIKHLMGKKNANRWEKNPQRDVGAVQVNPLCTFRTSLNKGKFSSTLAWLQE